MPKRRTYSRSRKSKKISMRKRKRGSHSKSRKYHKRSSSKTLRLRGKSFAKVSGRKGLTRKSRQPRKKFANLVKAVIESQLAVHTYQTRAFSASISATVGTCTWVFARPAGDPTLLATYATALAGEVTGGTAYDSKTLHCGTTKVDTICNMGSLPCQVEIFALVARNNINGVVKTYNANTQQIMTAAQLVANDDAIYAASANYTDISSTPFRYPSLVKYFKIKRLGMRVIGGARSLQIRYPRSFTFKTIDTRGMGPIGDVTYGGMYYAGKGQLLLLYKVKGFMGPDDSINTLTENVTTGVFTATDMRDVNGATHLGSGSATVIVMTESYSDMKMLNDNVREISTTNQAFSGNEPLAIRPLELQRHY